MCLSHLLPQHLQWGSGIRAIMRFLWIVKTELNKVHNVLIDYMNQDQSGILPSENKVSSNWYCHDLTWYSEPKDNVHIHVNVKFSVHSRRGTASPDPIPPHPWMLVCVCEHMCQVPGGNGVSVAALRVFLMIHRPLWIK